MKKINNKALGVLALIILDIIVMVISAYHIFNLNMLTNNSYVALYAVAFAVSFGVYCKIRYKDDSKAIGRWNAIALLVGLAFALFGGSNIPWGISPESFILKYTCYASLTIGCVLYLWNDYKSNELTEC